MKLYFTQINPIEESFKASLMRKGWQVCHHPFRQVVFAEVDISKDLEEVDALVLTSKNAAKWLLARPYNLKSIPFAAVGETSAELLSPLNLSWLTEPAANARELAQTLRQTLPSGAKVLFLCGNRTSGELEKGLDSKCLMRRVVYSTEQIAPKNAAIESESMVYFQAPSTVEDFFSRYPFRPKWVGAIGPTTRHALELRSWQVDFQPSRPELRYFVNELPLAGGM